MTQPIFSKLNLRSDSSCRKQRPLRRGALYPIVASHRHEFGIPVLNMSAKDGVVFDQDGTQALPPTPDSPAAPAPEEPSLIPWPPSFPDPIPPDHSDRATSRRRRRREEGVHTSSERQMSRGLLAKDLAWPSGWSPPMVRRARCVQCWASQRDTRAFHSQARAGRICPLYVYCFQLVPGVDVLQHMASCLQTSIDVRAGALHIAGHEQHHLDSIEMNYGGGSSDPPPSVRVTRLRGSTNRAPSRVRPNRGTNRLGVSANGSRHAWPSGRPTLGTCERPVCVLA